MRKLNRAQLIDRGFISCLDQHEVFTLPLCIHEDTYHQLPDDLQAKYTPDPLEPTGYYNLKGQN